MATPEGTAAPADLATPGDTATPAGTATAAGTGNRKWAVVGRVLRAPYSARTWRMTSHVVLGGPIGLVSGLTVLVLAVLTLGLAVTVVLAAVTFAQLLIFNWVFTSWQRSRFAELLNVDIPPQPPPPPAPLFRRLLREARTAGTWRQLAYHGLAGVLGPAGAAAVVGAWSAGLVLTGAPLYPGISGVGELATRAGLSLAGLALLLAAPWLARAIATVDVAAARRLLGPSRGQELAARLESLRASRDGAVGAADAERRRIERNLHDGAQQRLTSLALNLGMARADLSGVPAPAQDAIVRAHDEAKEALEELRDFVRGMHPAVLDERGLDAALSGVAARSPVPVRLVVDLPETRLPPAVEAVAYYLVSETLTNVAKHARAAQVELRVEASGGRLRVEVRDDGQGGADPGGGTGLHGLAQRVGSVDGTLHVESPPGGPTTIVADLPCGS